MTAHELPGVTADVQPFAVNLGEDADTDVTWRSALPQLVTFKVCEALVLSRTPPKFSIGLYRQTAAAAVAKSIEAMTPCCGINPVLTTGSRL